MQYDVLIIGGGVTGCAIARELSQYTLRCALAEAGEDVANGASRANSAVVHAGYDADTLKLEYERDLGKGMDAQVPKNYFPDDDPTKDPIVNWRSTGQLLYSNWLNFYVYQSTPYDIRTI